MRSLLPPRKRDWRPGTMQIGFSIRFPNGSVIEFSGLAAADEHAAALELLRLATRPAAERQHDEATLAAILEIGGKP